MFIIYNMYRKFMENVKEICSLFIENINIQYLNMGYSYYDERGACIDYYRYRFGYDE